MNESRVKIHELIEQTMEALLALGCARQTVWGAYGSCYLPINKFFKNRGVEYYDAATLSEYSQMIKRRWENKEVSTNFYRRARKAVERLTEFYDTGKVDWSFRTPSQKFKLTYHFENILADFLAAEKFSPNRRRDYAWAVRKYLAYLQRNGHLRLDTITADDLRNFIIYCAEKLAGSSLRGMVCYLRRFHNYLQKTNQLYIEDSRLLCFPVVRDQKIQPYLSWDEITRTMEQIDRSTDVGKRDYAIVLLGVRTGLRAVDIANLRLRDIDWRAGTIHILQRKTGVPVTLPLMMDVGKAIQEYILKARPACDSEHIFIRIHTPYRQMPDGNAIGCMFNHYQQKAGIVRKPLDGKGFHALFGLLHDFLKVYLPGHKNSSPHTIKAYRTSLELLFDFVKREQNISLGEITFELLTKQTVTAYLDWLERGRGCSIETRNQRLACIRAFFKYAAAMEPTAVIYNIELRKIAKKKPTTPGTVEFMNERAVKALLEQPDVKTKKGLRDQFLMILLYDTGARIQEILNLRLKDIHPEETPTVTLLGKGSKVRTVPLMVQTVKHFKNYTEIFHPGEDAYSSRYLFYIQRNGNTCPMSDDNVLKFMKQYGAAARATCPDVPENVYSHLWRHSRAMHLYQSGMDLTLVSQWLGHASLETTLIYAHADTEQKRKAIETATSMQNPLRSGSLERFCVDDDEMLKRLYGLK